MDYLRIGMITLCQVIISITLTSPNSEKELGTQENDKLCEEGISNNHFMKFCIINLITWYYSFQYLISSDGDMIGITEFILFGIVLFGFFLRIMCYFILGNFFTFNLGTRGNHRLIEKGPYKYLVHPSYTAETMIIYGTLLLIEANYIFIIAMLYVSYSMAQICKLEEEVMLRKFNVKYMEYIRRRDRFIPYIY